VYEYACKQINLPPYECIAVEDSPNGVKAAHSAGCFTVMVPDMSSCTDELKDVVDVVAGDLSEIIDKIA
jgi:beta-phosphoglucomutase-like phosphatase (HAD superfamily)